MRLTSSSNFGNAILEIIENITDLHALPKQMGTSVGMIEKHYSKQTATMAPDRLALRKYE